MRAPLLLLWTIVVFSVAVARALSCVCSRLECDVLTDEDCPGGLTWDPCRCCKVCARVEGEPCGGPFGFSGSCAVGLQCVIKNLLHRGREVDEGVCEKKIPSRWRRHCPHGPIMSGSGCNLVGDGIATETGNAVGTGKCVCGPSVPWCPDEPRPYVYTTRKECNLNLAAKIAYDDLFNSGDPVSDDVEGGLDGAECPEDSVREENGDCKCAAECPPTECPPGQRSILVRRGDPETPGSCCPRYDCVPSDPRGSEACPEDSVLTEDGKCKCVPCPPPSCKPGQHPVKATVPETPGSCCPLYDCRPSESVSVAKIPPDVYHCMYEGKPKKIGERWQGSDSCTSCVCEEDGHHCQATMCKSCDTAITRRPGECCPHCPSTTNVTNHLEIPVPPCPSLDDCDLGCDHGYVIDENNCPTCECAKRKKDDEDDSVVDLLSPEGKICPKLSHCTLNCELATDKGGCSVCACQPPRPFDDSSNYTAPTDETGKKICPEVKCDLHCKRGLVMDENDCTFCECKAAEADCPPLVGCRKRCPFGYKNNKRGCPICRCRVSCIDHLNETHPEGSTWNPNSCTTCTCEAGGRLNCKETICSVACADPLPPRPGTCCPVCPITTLKESETSHQGTRGWGTVPITIIVILAGICLLLIVHIVRSRFRRRLSPSEEAYSSYPPQYYKCVPAYDTPVHRNEKIVPL